jgi:hypothetical protein
MKSRKKTL